MTNYDVFGIGSALMDFLIEVDHDKLIELNLKKGHFHLMTKEETKLLLKNIEKLKVKTAPGGSSANTLYGVALLGGRSIFCGKVGKDKDGTLYREMMFRGGVNPILGLSENITGHAITFITPDTERTFAVHLGASLDLKKEDIVFKDLKNSKILHIEGYQLEDRNLREVSLHAMEFAKNNNMMISMDLGDPGIVSRNKEDIREMIIKYADIVFANEHEAFALTGKEPKEALDEISTIADIAIVKIGKEGSYIKQKNSIQEIKGYKTKAIDTTGAGDMFAAGVLYGITKGCELDVCGRIGSYFASKVVEKIGARLDEIDKKELDKLIKDVD